MERKRAGFSKSKTKNAVVITTNNMDKMARMVAGTSWMSLLENTVPIARSSGIPAAMSFVTM